MATRAATLGWLLPMFAQDWARRITFGSRTANCRLRGRRRSRDGDGFRKPLWPTRWWDTPLSSPTSRMGRPSSRSNCAASRRAAVVASVAPNTWRAYRSDLADFATWVAYTSADWRSPEVVAAYLRTLEDGGAAYATMTRRLTSIHKLVEIAAPGTTRLLGGCRLALPRFLPGGR